MEDKKNNNLENYNTSDNNIDNEEFVNNDNKQEFQDINYNDAEYTEAEYRELDEKNRFEFDDSQQPKDSRNYGKLFLTVFAAFALGATSVFGAQAVMGTGKALTSSVTATKEDKDNQKTTVNAISKAKDAVVSIVNYQSASNNNLDSILGENSSKRSKYGSSNRDSNNSGDLKPASSGSGVIYKKSGNTAYIVTNNHVVNGAKKLSVILSDGTNVTAEVVGTDVWTDLAVLKIKADNVKTTMDFADSDKIAVGKLPLQ